MHWALCLVWLAASAQDAPKEQPEKGPPPTVSLFGEQFIRPADAIAIGRIVSVSRINARSVFVARFEVSELLKGEEDEGRDPVLLLMAHSPEAFSVDSSERVVFARQYRTGSRFHLAEGQFVQSDPSWKEKLTQLRFLTELEKSKEPLEKRRQILLERLLDQAARAPEWTRNNGLRELDYLADRSPELFGSAERDRLRALIEAEKDRARLRVLRGVLERLDRPWAADEDRSGRPPRRRKKG